MYLWHETLFLVLVIINLVILFLFLVPLLFQMFSTIVALLSKKKKYPKADKQVKVAYIIPAHNEEDVIFDTVKDLLDAQDYPKDKLAVYVVADNCTDNTAKLAKEAGATVLIREDPDPSRHMARFPLQYGIDYILKYDTEAELIIHADADNHFNKEFSQKMNDAYLYKDGYDFLRPYEGAINGTQNFFTKACTFFYAFDSRIGARSREILHIAQHVQGSGATMSRRMLLKCGGYDSTSISDDSDFCFKRLLDGVKAHFVEEAIVYEDMPSTAKDTINRNTRIKQGTKELFQQDISKMPKMFLKTKDFSYLEVPLTYIWIFIGAPFFIWLLLFGGYFFTYSGLGAGGVIELSHYSPAFFQGLLMNILWIFIGVAIFLFLLFFVGVTFVLVFQDYEKFGAKSRREMADFIFLLLFYLLVYAFSLMTNNYQKKGWEQIKRNAPKN